MDELKLEVPTLTIGDVAEAAAEALGLPDPGGAGGRPAVYLWRRAVCPEAGKAQQTASALRFPRNLPPVRSGGFGLPLLHDVFTVT